ncbi:transposase [Planomonospora algeriensis]
MNPRRAYPSDIFDARWVLTEPILTAWRQARLDRRHTGAPAPTDLRDIFNTILYLNRTGIAWACLPHDFPPHGTVYSYYAAKKIVGRKRSVATDALGLLLAVTVCAASVSENQAGIQVLDQAKADHPTLALTWVDIGFKKQFADHAATLGVHTRVVHRDPGTRGFHVLPRRWVIERTFGWLMLHRRLARDYETLPVSSEAMIHIAMIDNTSKRITGENTPTWRGTY